MEIPRIYRLLQILHPKLFNNSMTITPLNKENNSLGMDGPITIGLGLLKDTYVRGTSANLTKFQQKVLPPSGCIGVWRGRRTLTRGRSFNPLTQIMAQTSVAPHLLL